MEPEYTMEDYIYDLNQYQNILSHLAYYHDLQKYVDYDCTDVDYWVDAQHEVKQRLVEYLPKLNQLLSLR